MNLFKVAHGFIRSRQSGEISPNLVTLIRLPFYIRSECNNVKVARMDQHVFDFRVRGSEKESNSQALSLILSKYL